MLVLLRIHCILKFKPYGLLVEIKNWNELFKNEILLFNVSKYSWYTLLVSIYDANTLNEENPLIESALVEQSNDIFTLLEFEIKIIDTLTYLII